MNPPETETQRNKRLKDRIDHPNEERIVPVLWNPTGSFIQLYEEIKNDPRTKESI